MKQQHELQGLCITCNHAESCMYLASAQQPIWHCEEFDDSGTAAVASEMKAARASSTASVAEVTERPLGLCSNCDNFATCRFPKAEGGVWYCEEYA